jgi:hypothetical protein
MTGFSVGRIVGRRVVQVLPAAFLAASLCCGTAAAEVTEQEAKRQVEEAYDVEVLKVREGEIDGRAVWLVTVMLPQGDFNTAFMVSHLAILGPRVPPPGKRLRPAGRPARRQGRAQAGRRAQLDLAIAASRRRFSQAPNPRRQPRTAACGLRKGPGVAAWGLLDSLGACRRV